MPRTREDRHPALTQVSTKDAEQVQGIPGWDTFSKAQREFLLLLAYVNNEQECMRQLGLAPMWSARNKKATPLFRQAVEERKYQGLAIVQSVGTELLAKSMTKLTKMLENDENPKLQLEAIKHIHKLMGATKDSPQTVVQQNNTSIGSTPMFDGFRSAKPRTVEAKAEIVEDEEEE